MAEIRAVIIRPDRPDRKHKKPTIYTPERMQAFEFIKLYNLCRNLNVLPRSGGLLDQDSLYVFLANHALICEEDRRKLDQAQAEMDQKMAQQSGAHGGF